MKKTLAIILALIMLLSVALVSCSKEGKETEAPTDDFWGNVEDTDPDDENNGTETDAQGNQISSSDYHTNANGDVYVLHPVKVREKDKKTSKSTVGTLSFGQKVSRIAMNATWSKISFSDNGVVKEGYVYNEILTTDAKAVNVVMLDTPVEVEITGLGKDKDGRSISINVRSTPWNCSATECKVADYVNINVLPNINNKKYAVIDGFKVIKLGATEDGKWVRVKYDVTFEGKTVTEWGFVSATYIKTDGSSAGDAVNPNDEPVIAPIL
jgi:hypothetical protein